MDSKRYKTKTILVGLAVTLEKGRQYDVQVQKQVIKPDKDVEVEIVDVDTMKVVETINVKPDQIQGFIVFFPAGTW